MVFTGINTRLYMLGLRVLCDVVGNCGTTGVGRESSLKRAVFTECVSLLRDFTAMDHLVCIPIVGLNYCWYRSIVF